MTYGTLKIDTITFTDDGIDKSVSVSGLVQNPSFSGNITATGTISGDIIRGQTISGVTVTGTTTAFTSGSFISLTGTTTQGTTATYVSGSFTSLTGTTLSGTTTIYTTGTFTSLTGTTTTGITSSFVTGTFTSLTGITTTGTSANFESGVFTTQLSGTTITGNAAAFTTVTGGTATITSGVFAAGTAAAPSISVRTTNNGIYSPGTNKVAISTNGTERLLIDDDGNVGIGVSSVTNVANRSQLVIGGSSGGLIDLSYGATAAEGRIFVNDGELVLFAAQSDGDLVFQTAGNSERLRIHNSGKILTGTSIPRTDLIGGTRGGRVQIEAANSNATTAIDNSGLCLTMGNSAGPGSANIFFTRTKSNSLGGVAIVTDNDILGGLYFQGTDGTDAVPAALIKAEVDGTPGADDMPGRLVFSVTADGASSPTEAMRIKNSRILNFANTPVYADNAAAKTGGLVDGDVYRKSDGTLMIVYT